MNAKTAEDPLKGQVNPFENKKELLTDPVFLIGNGSSRKNFDLERLRGKGTIIGCNALYRDFSPDLLIAIDAKILTELKKDGYCKDHECLVPGNRTVDLKDTLRWRTDKFNTSGCFAMKLIALIMKPSKCYMIGMDGFPGNMYDGTVNYAKNTLMNFSGVLNYYMQVLQLEANTMFINVNHTDKWPSEAHDTGRYSFMLMEDFEKLI